MPALAICTAADVIRRFGGQSEISRCIADPENPGTYNATLLNALIGDSSEEISARGNVQVDVRALAQAIATGAVSEWPAYLVDIVAWLTVAKVWDAGTSGQAKPQHIADKERYILDTECERLRKREISLGAPTTYPGTNQLLRVVDPDPNRNRMTRSAWRSRGGLG